MQLGQFLASQLGPKVPVVCANEVDCRSTGGFIRAPIRHPAALLVDQSSQACRLITLGKTTHLAGRDAQPLRCILLADFMRFQHIQYPGHVSLLPDL